LQNDKEEMKKTTDRGGLEGWEHLGGMEKQKSTDREEKSFQLKHIEKVF